MDEVKKEKSKPDYPAGNTHCHPACIYRKKRNGRLICTNKETHYEDRIADINRYGYCPIDADYFNHQDTYYSEILTEKGLVRLALYAGEPLWIPPAFEIYLSWLKKKRKSITVLKMPSNTCEMGLYNRHLITDMIFAEFLLDEEQLEKIETLKQRYYESILERVPDELKNILTIKERRRRWEEKPTEDELPMIEKYGNFWDSTYWLGHIVGDFYKSGKLSRDEYLTIRNHFDDWE